MNDDDVARCFSRWQTANPHPTTELQYRSTFELLVAVMLSAQTTDSSVNKATPALFALAPTPEAMLALGEANVRQCIKSIGLYNTKARHLMATCTRLVNEFSGRVPETRNDLESLPGVGRKTANVLLNTAFRQPALAVDTHIFRVANRTGLGRGKNVRAVETALLARIPLQYITDAHHWLVLHGRYVCTARRPQCNTCLINDLCDSLKDHTLPDAKTT